MNIKEYISSGIIESYVLGLTTQQDKIDFENMCAQYPEVLQARLSFEESLEHFVIQNSISVPDDLNEKIRALIRPGEENIIEASDEVVAAPVRSMNWLKFAAVASIILLAISVYWNISLYNRNNQLTTSYTNLEKQMNDYSAKLAEMKKDADILQKPGMKMAALQGTNNSPQSFATVFWDTASKDVYLMINNLPQPATDKQYQLWALLNGKPIDLGVFELKKEKLLVQMKGVEGAEAFAITLEKKGGNPSPTMDAMYVIGKL